ncbi:MAG: hypothetical protein AB7K71_34965 [Polyangiaceae bacterium]
MDSPRQTLSQPLRALLLGLGVSVFAPSALYGCASGGSEQPTYTPPTYYKPGASLSRVSCTCLACVSASACEGRAPMARDEMGCEDGFSMQQSTRFEATVSSCQPSCFKRNWSVPQEVECDDRRPDDCCADY